MKKIDDSQFIWSEKYRPQTLDDVIIDEKTRSKFKEFIKDERFPHILLSSTNPGVGKCLDYDEELELWVEDSLYIKLIN